MKRLIPILSFLAALGLTGPVRAAITDFDQKAALFSTNGANGLNWSSQRGVPLSGTTNTPAGSDGRLKDASTPSQRQFAAVVTISAVAAPRGSTNFPNGTVTASYEALEYPVAKREALVVQVLRYAQVGAPYFSKPPSFLFGMEIPPPSVDAAGTLLPPGTNIFYWRPQPQFVEGQTNYYWSSNANKVFAVRSGNVDITWRGAKSSLTAPPSPIPFVKEGEFYYPLRTERHFVSGAASKTPRLMYWTEKSFRTTGKPITVPTGRILAVHIVFNQRFTETVTNEFVAQGESEIVPAEDRLLVLRTLWFDEQQKQIFAYNLEGRVFMELLGELRPDGGRRFLGSEIVDVIRQPTPEDIHVELGDRMPAYESRQDDSKLFPEPVVIQPGQGFHFSHTVSGSDRATLYATKETRNLNDEFVHWMEEGEAGLKWPRIYARYELRWPTNIARYSHYIRPNVATVEDARKTAVALPPENVPVIEYQDPFDQPRAFLTESFGFYTFLQSPNTAHRTLLRLNAGENVRFERVFSWLENQLREKQFAGTVATTLSEWDKDNVGAIIANEAISPRMLAATVEVGQRINPPEAVNAPELPYLAGHIRTEFGTSYNTNAYKDPFVVGFNAAAGGAIIPVNAEKNPGGNLLEVHWFRGNSTNLLAEQARGFQPIYWPSVIGRYTVRWPEAPSEIVLADNRGSGPLPSYQARGTIYVQNDRTKHGYNPNEEHALMQSGQAWALRDDLNLMGDTAATYSSRPFVLLQYADPDGRPAMRVFKLLREKPEANKVFDYTVDAGTVLQAPMPLPLLEKPLVARVTGEAPRSYNIEIPYWLINEASVIPATATRTALDKFKTSQRHYFTPMKKYWLQAPRTVTAEPRSGAFYPLTIDHDTHTMEGIVLSGGQLLPLTQDFALSTGDPKQVHFIAPLTSVAGFGAGDKVLILLPDSGKYWWAEVLAKTIRPADASISLKVAAEDSEINTVRTSRWLALPAPQTGRPSFLDWHIAPEKFPEPLMDANVTNFFAAFTMQDRKGNTWVYRGPHDAGENPSTTLQFYYRTLSGFFFPTAATQPPVGTVTPYLRAGNANGTFAGHPVFGDEAGDRKPDGNALGIKYRPQWPVGAPILNMAETLHLPKRGLPGVRDQSSLEVLYQQSQIKAVASKSVVLHDPEREKIFLLGPKGDPARLGEIPPSVATQEYQGKKYFPILPPHLVERFFFDPNLGQYGGLVFRGKFIDEPLGEDYALLNVIGGKDYDALVDLCLPQPAHLFNQWKAVFGTGGLTATLNLHVENPARPGTFIPSSPNPIGPDALCEITDDDVDKVNYALTAMGPGSGFVSLIAGNGLAFTPEADTVTVYVIRVSDTLHRGELKVIAASNPLAEKLTLQQTVDLAGHAEEFDFEWRIAAPVDGAPPAIHQFTPKHLPFNGGWSHVPYPLAADRVGSIHNTIAQRVRAVSGATVIPVTRVGFTAEGLPVTWGEGGKYIFTLPLSASHQFVSGNAVVIRDQNGNEIPATIDATTDPRQIVVAVDAGQSIFPDTSEITELNERLAAPDQPQTYLFREVTIPPDSYSDLWLSLKVNPALGVRVYIDGQLAVVANTGNNDTTPQFPPKNLEAPLPLSLAFRLNPTILSGAASKHIFAVELFSGAAPDAELDFEMRLHAMIATNVVDTSGAWIALDSLRHKDGIRAILGESADVRSLSDNYLTMRYRAKALTHASARDLDGDRINDIWSAWTEPQLAEGWIKRALAGINPFNQRVSDLFNNRANTDASIISQAGGRWEGDVALNLDTINNYGLIEIYETILRRGKGLSINSGIAYGPANDALLLAAGYLNDLYMMLGNEALADAANPTIGIGTKDNTYGDIATALFAFKGQTASLLEEELALLRGRDDFMQPGVEVSPAYNRLFWNYTRGIDSGEVIYALNYNIQENNDTGVDGVINADDARKMYPQGHGDAYGHYLSALKGYYALLMDTDFDWVPRSEAVTILGKPVQVDYQDERKFAAAAAALARAGRQVFDLTWRKDYSPGHTGWTQFAETRNNTNRSSGNTTRYWGMDHWATRAAEGAYINWVVGNSMLPYKDPDPAHEGIQKIDRTTVPELAELPAILNSVQTSLDNAEAGLSPLGLSESSVAFDIDPNKVVGSGHTTHFEQIYERATATLNNAVAAFDDSKDITRLMRSEQDSLVEFQAGVDSQERAYQNSLIELYGSPYPDDIGAGETYRQGYAGPDLFHYMYVDLPEQTFPELWNHSSTQTVFNLDLQNVPSDWTDRMYQDFDFIIKADETRYKAARTLPFNLGKHGFYEKPSEWTSRRAAPGRAQQAISEIISAHLALKVALYANTSGKSDLDKSIRLFQSKVQILRANDQLARQVLDLESEMSNLESAHAITSKAMDSVISMLDETVDTMMEFLPESTIFGLAAGGDLMYGGRIVQGSIYLYARAGLVAGDLGEFVKTENQLKNRRLRILTATKAIADLQIRQELEEGVYNLFKDLEVLHATLDTINAQIRQLDDAQRNYRALLAEGNRIQAEREIFRKRSAAVVQGFRTRDAAFRILRNEKLERYKTLFDLAATYAFLAANAYDYETGLLNTSEGRKFVNRIVNSRALGVVRDGQPLFAGSNTGDPGLSSALAEMKADWDVLKGRLGFNNPDAYGTTVSMRAENYRILPGAPGLQSWKDVMETSRVENLLDDPDIKQHCLQLNTSGQPVPGIVITFSTAIVDGYNLFGRQLAGGDHNFNPSSFATKIFGVGVAFEGYQGMDNPSANTTVIEASGANSPSDPSPTFMSQTALAATPYVYLVPVGVDKMRSPPLGDQSSTREWSVEDITIPLPFNIGASGFSSRPVWRASDSLTERLFSVRKHQAFRPVSNTDAFDSAIFADDGQLNRSQFTNNRLIGRSVWNSQWKLVIPGSTLLSDPKEGLDRFIQTVTDVKLHFVTYSYSGN